MILFLDFDGVLHPIYSGVSSNADFRNLPLLEDFLREHKNISVVISSSWRENMDLDDLQHLFTKDLMDRIIGKCPIVPAHDHWRHQEILTWINQNNYAGQWFALDDAINEFPDDCPQLIACDKHEGLTEEVLLTLKLALKRQ
ncbi:MAG: HAD domain-containing protein [Oscillospiraceae bacterium]